jgi:hypothetical protein
MSSREIAGTNLEPFNMESLIDKRKAGLTGLTEKTIAFLIIGAGENKRSQNRTEQILVCRHTSPEKHKTARKGVVSIPTFTNSSYGAPVKVSFGGYRSTSLFKQSECRHVCLFWWTRVSQAQFVDNFIGSLSL